MWFVLSPFCWFIAWTFFCYFFALVLVRCEPDWKEPLVRYFPKYEAYFYNFDFPAVFSSILALLPLAVVYTTGWKIQNNNISVLDSLVEWNRRGLDSDTATTMVAEHYTSRITGCAFFLSLLFLLAPLSLFRAIRHWKRQLPAGPQNEARIAAKLEELAQINKWQGLSEHSGDEATIIQLGIMNLIDISTIPSIRFKAKSPSSPHA